MPRSDPKQLGFIGYGNMGAPMAQNLAAYLHDNGYPPLLLWTRTTSKLPPASDLFAHADSPADLAAKCDVVVTSLANDEAARSVYAELFKGAEDKAGKGDEGTVFVDTSTLYPTTCGELERQASKIRHTTYLGAPVFGPPPMAKDASLVIVLSGDTFAKRRVEKFLVPAMGQRIIDVGNNVEKAAAFKLCGNGTIVGIIELIAEMGTLADRAGVSFELYREFLTTFLPAPSVVGYSKKIMDNQFDSDNGFTVLNGLKDVSHIRQLAQSCGSTLPALDAAHRHLVTALAHGGGNLDWSSLVAGPRLAAGLAPFTGNRPFAHDTGFGARTDDGEAEEKKRRARLEPVPAGGIKEVRNF
ncbi:NAD(P)-dependent oxidoreductase [Rhodotorula paludigena]|uniref:NAD(P)-dependent oxidoreductase n=1 Tax=Rhodotorula paludigena TaxID=86838 RepID=UPI003174B3E8